MTTDNEEHSGGVLAKPIIIIVVWIFIIVVFMILPCCTARQRKIWVRRFVERKWNVVVEDEEDRWFIEFFERYRFSQDVEETESNYTKKEAEEMMKVVVLEKISPFTKVLQKADFKLTVCDNTSTTNPELPIVTQIVPQGEDGPNSQMNVIIDAKVDDIGNTLTESTKPRFADIESGFVESGVSRTNCDSFDPDNVCIVKEHFVDSSVNHRAHEKNVTQDSRSSSLNYTSTEKYAAVILPLPGVPVVLTKDKMQVGDWECSECDQEKMCEEEKFRDVPVCCAICLADYEEKDHVCWSSNTSCPHVFHEECIVGWLVTLGRKQKRQGYDGMAAEERNPMSYNMLCPCCRQAFVVKKADDAGSMLSTSQNGDEPILELSNLGVSSVIQTSVTQLQISAQ